MNAPSRPPAAGLAAAVLIAAAALLSCGPLFVIEVETEELCLSLGEQEVPGMPVGAQEVRHTLSLPIGRALAGIDLSRASGRLDFVRAEIVAREGLEDFGWVERLSADARACGGSTRVLEYNRGPETKGTTLRVPGREGLDVARLARADVLELEVLFRGEPPATAWSAEVTICLHPRLKVDYGGMLLGDDSPRRECPDSGERPDGGSPDAGPDAGDGGTDGGAGDGGVCAELRTACSAEVACCGGPSQATCGAGGTCCRPSGYVCGAGNLNCCTGCCSNTSTCLVTGVCS